MTKTTKILAGVGLAALATAGVAAAIRYRQGQDPDPDEHAQLDELDSRLSVVEARGKDVPSTRIDRVIDNLRRNRDISVERLRKWIAGLKHGTLNTEQATLAESDFDALEREADQGNA
jgi:hypothetical protein